VSDAPEFAGTDRFEIREHLGQGGMGVVYRTWDHERQTEVALKTLLYVDPENLLRLKNEFRGLAGVTHPNLAALHELFFERGQWFFTMELVQGFNFLTWTRGLETLSHMPTAEVVDTPTLSVEDALNAGTAGWTGTVGPPSAERLLPALQQLALGVQALHRAGKQHRDLKPANVMVAHDGRVVLLDFGLVVERQVADVDESVPEGLAGTPAYMAPELFQGLPVTEASDWYSVGVMLYETLTGKRPWKGSPLLRRGEFAPDPPIAVVPSLPPDLSALTMELMAWDPADRPTGAQVLDRLGVDAGSTVPTVDSADLSAVFVGRGRQLRALNDAFDQLREGSTVRVDVVGPSGVGKSALVRHFLRRLKRRRTGVILTGRCYENESLPYKIFDSLIDALGRYLRKLGPARLTELLPDDIRVLARLFPVLLRVPSIDAAARVDDSVVDVQQLSNRASAALKELLRRLGSRRRLVLWIDDLQWGDQDSLRLLRDLFAAPDTPRLMLIATFRSEELEGNPILEQILADAAVNEAVVRRTVDVGPLSSEEARELASRLLVPRTITDDTYEHGAEPEAYGGRLAAIVRESEGNPFFVQQCVEHMRSLSEDSGLGLGQVLRRRIEALPETTQRVLSLVAVAGRPLPLELVVKASDVSGRAHHAVEQLCNVHLAKTERFRDNERVETFHDRIRETVVADLSASMLAARHRALAEVYEAQPEPDVEALATHWAEAGEPGKAAGYAVAAGDAAAATLAFDQAAARYRRALELGAAAGERRPLREKLAHALANAGRGPEAGEGYLLAADGAPEERALELRRRACEQFLISGHVGRGMGVAQDLLDGVGWRLPTTATSALVSMLWQRFRVTIRGLRFRERAEDEVPQWQRMRADLCWSMATGMSIVDTKLGADFTARYLIEALRSGETGRIARALAFEAAHRSSSGGHKSAARLLDRARATAEKRSDPHALGFVDLMAGFASYFDGRWADAVGFHDSAHRIFSQRCTGVTWEISNANLFGNWALVYSGRWDELARRGPRQLEAARRRGNVYEIHGLRMGYGIVSQLRAGNLDGARQQQERAAREWQTSGFQAEYQIQDFLNHYMGTWLDLYEGEGPAAMERLQAMWPALRRSLLLNILDVKQRMIHIRAYAAIAAGSNPQLLKSALKDARTLERIHCPGNAAIAAVVRASVAHKRGDPAAAILGLADAVARFEADGMPHFAAGARRQRGRLLGGDEGAAHVAQADAALTEIGIAEPERATALFAPGF